MKAKLLSLNPIKGNNHAVTQSRDNRTLIAGADLSTSQFLFAKMDAAAKAVLAGDGEGTIGVIAVGAEAGNACTITHSGKSW